MTLFSDFSAKIMFYHRFGLFFALFLGIKQGLCELKTLFLCSESFSFMSMTVTDIYEMMNSKAGAFFEWLQTHPKYGLLFCVGLLVLWLVGLLLRWDWAYHWQFNSKLWFFDDCKPETRRRIKIVLVSLLIILMLIDFFVWK